MPAESLGMPVKRIGILDKCKTGDASNYPMIAS